MSQAIQLQQKSFAFTWCFPVTFAFGATALFLGTVTLFTERRAAVVSALHHLALQSTDWLLLDVGVVLLLISSAILTATVKSNRKVRLTIAGAGASLSELQTLPPTTLKPPASKIQAATLNALLLGLGLPAFAVVTFLLRPSASLILVVFFFFLVGVITLTNAVDSLSCRAQIFDEEIQFWTWFRAKRFPAFEVRSAEYSRYRSTTSLTVLGDRSWFTVSSNSFDPTQLDAIRKFCDQAARIYPDWSSKAEVGAL